MTRRLRVFQVASANGGTEMVKRIVKHPDMQLVGLHCYSPDKIGRDASDIVGIGPIGVTATGTIDDILATHPDCLTFHGVWPDTDLYERVLEAGINVVTTADWVTGHHRDTNHRRNVARESEILQAACVRGNSTFYGTGMNPGLTQILTIVHSADVAVIENVTCIESVDVSCHHSAETWANCGFGRPVGDPEIPHLLELGTRAFEDSVRLMADCLDIELDEGTFGCELGASTKDVDLGWYQLPAGSLGGCVFSYVGKAGGTPRVELHLEWQMTPHTDSHWNIQGCYITKIQGDPCIYSKHLNLPKPGTDFSSVEAFATIGMTVTAMPALNSIRAVVDAAPASSPAPTCRCAHSPAASRVDQTRVPTSVAAGQDRRDDAAQPAGDVTDGDDVRNAGRAPAGAEPRLFRRPGQGRRRPDHRRRNGYRPSPPRDTGRIAPGTDDAVDAHQALVEAVHEHGAKIQPQIVHAGPDGLAPEMRGVTLIGPSVIPSYLTGRPSAEVTHEQLIEVFNLFKAAVRRGAEAVGGFEYRPATGHPFVAEDAQGDRQIVADLGPNGGQRLQHHPDPAVHRVAAYSSVRRLRCGARKKPRNI